MSRMNEKKRVHHDAHRVVLVHVAWHVQLKAHWLPIVFADDLLVVTVGFVASVGFRKVGSDLLVASAALDDVGRISDFRIPPDTSAGGMKPIELFDALVCLRLVARTSCCVYVSSKLSSMACQPTANAIGVETFLTCGLLR